MIRLDHVPTGTARGHLGLVGKGITYDSGGISLKPSNAMHAAMKMDMSGAGAVLAAMTVLAELDVPVRVTAYLACTDNMPSGSATKLGDVLTTRSGRTIEVVNTDAEGRLVMADAIDLVTEAGVEAILDVATLTGAALMALGPQTAAVIGNDDAIVALVEDAARATDEQVWRLPLDRRYRPWLESEVADLKNLGGESAGAITAALFLAEWVGATPWAHLDIAGPMRSDTDDAWRTKGATGFGARLLVEAISAYAAS
jgi:leucyl aminopeptidase